MNEEERSTCTDSGDFVEGNKIIQGDEVHGDKVEDDKHVYTRSQEEELDDHLARAVAAYEADILSAVLQSPTSFDEPYKFLDAFTLNDTNLFFGRDRAKEDLYQTLLKDRLTILHAKSGAGKTSLLNAGLSPHLISEGRLPVYARAYEDPVLAIKQAIHVLDYLRTGDNWQTHGITVGEPATRLSLDDPDREPEQVLTNEISLTAAQSQELLVLLQSNQEALEKLSEKEEEEVSRALHKAYCILFGRENWELLGKLYQHDPEKAMEVIQEITSRSKGKSKGK